jgi:hypothetical protein
MSSPRCGPAFRKRALLDKGDTEMPICVRKYRYLAWHVARGTAQHGELGTVDVDSEAMLGKYGEL